MEIWLDSTDLILIDKAQKMGVLSGVTTNPSIISRSELPLEEIIDEILKVQPNPVAVQVTAKDAKMIVEQGEAIHGFSDPLIVKIPVTEEGLKAINTLSRLDIPTMATAIFTAEQALLATKAGADYLAPYFSHMADAKRDPLTEIESMISFIDLYEFKTKIIGAAFKSVDQVVDCMELGIHGVTLKDELFSEFTKDHAQTLKHVQRFQEDWKKAKPSSLLSDIEESRV